MLMKPRVFQNCGSKVVFFYLIHIYINAYLWNGFWVIPKKYVVFAFVIFEMNPFRQVELSIHFFHFFSS